jgi:DNA/RNA endonuclease G (NUC1)
VTIGQILGSSTLGANYIKDIDYYLARGHLAARSDFVYSTHQRATFWFINTAPQWQTFNSGNWKVLEDNLREYENYNQIQINAYFFFAKIGFKTKYYVTLIFIYFKLFLYFLYFLQLCCEQW